MRRNPPMTRQSAWTLAWLLAAICLFWGWANPVGAQGAQDRPLQMLTINTPPLAYFEQGRLTGFGVDLVNELSMRLDRPVIIEMGAYADNLKRSRGDASVVLFPTMRTSASEDRFKWVGPLIPEQVCFYALRDSGITLSGLEAAKYVRAIATVGGYASEAFLREHGFDNLVSHRSPSQCADALKYGRVDLWLNSDVTMPSLARQADVDPASLKKVLTISEFPSYLAFSPATEDEVVDAWQRELDLMKADGSFEKLRSKWLPRMTNGVEHKRAEPSLVQFSQGELDWIASSPVIRVGVNPGREPLDYVDTRGLHAGYSSDVLRLLAERIGLVFEVQYGMTWIQTREAVAAGEIDMVSCLVPSDRWARHLSFTRPYLHFPSAIITAVDAPFVGGLEDIATRTVAAVRGEPTTIRLQEQHSAVRLLYADSAEEALEAVSRGDAFAYVGDLGVVGYLIRKRGLTNLKVAARTDFEPHDFVIGVRRDWPMLRTVLDKALGSLDEDTHARILARWVAPPPVQGGWNRTLMPWLWGVAATLTAVLLTMVIWNRRLHREVAERTHAEQNLADSERRYRELFDNAQVGIFEARLQDGGRFVGANRRMLEMLGYESEADLLEEPALADHLLDPTLAVELEQAMAAMHGFLRLRSGLRRRDGAEAWVELSGQIDEASGLVTGIVQDQSEQVQAEQALQESGALMRTVLDAIPFFVCLFGPDRRLKMANRAACELLGTDYDRLVGRHIGDVVPEETWAQFKPSEDKALSGQPSVVELSTDYARRQGTFSAYYSPHVDAFGQVQGVACCIIDLTARQRAEEDLRASEERYRVVVEQSMDAIVIGSMQGKLLYGNPASETLFGYGLDEVRGSDVKRFFHPDDWMRIAGLIGKTGALKYEARMLTKDGQVLFVENARSVIEYDGEPCVLVQIRDVTERHIASERLRLNEERLQTALESTEYGLWEIWLQSGQVEVPTRMFRDNFGFGEDELKRTLTDWSELLHPDDVERSKTVAREFLAGRNASLAHELRLQDAEGNWRWLWLQGKVVEHDAQGMPVRSLGVVQDITERKHAEERLRELATTDPLTGLANRRSFLDHAEREFGRSRRYGAPLSFLMLDMDRFKNINDIYGHDVGDMVLRSLAETGRKVLRGVDLMGRMGGEEFAVLLPETGIEEALAVAERLRANVEQSVVRDQDGGEVHCTVSLGVAQAHEDESLHDLLRRADAALYEAKNSGRNRVARNDGNGD